MESEFWEERFYWIRARRLSKECACEVFLFCGNETVGLAVSFIRFLLAVLFSCTR